MSTFDKVLRRKLEKKCVKTICNLGKYRRVCVHKSDLRWFFAPWWRCGRTLEAAPRPLCWKMKRENVGGKFSGPPSPSEHTLASSCGAWLLSNTSLPAFAGEKQLHLQPPPPATAPVSPEEPVRRSQPQEDTLAALQDLHHKSLSPSPRSACLHYHHRQEKVRLLTSCHSLKTLNLRWICVLNCFLQFQ